MLKEFTLDALRAAGPRDLSDELEKGRIVHFPECPIPLPAADDLDFLRDETPKHLSKKNFSYYHGARRLVGVQGDGSVRERLARILAQHGKNVHDFLARVMPDFTRGWTVGTTSLRPLQERGRDLSAHASNELIHFDAGAFGATHGDRVLRFFVNINPAENRIWTTKGTFPEIYPRFGSAAGVAPPERPEGDLEPGAGNRALSALLGGASRMGLRMARMLDTSPYDRAMRRFHNYMKDSPEFQATPEGHRQLEFGPFSAWMCLTDMVSHACIEGRHALVDTFLVPLENCRLKEQAPYYILKGAAEEKVTA